MGGWWCDEEGDGVVWGPYLWNLGRSCRLQPSFSVLQSVAFPDKMIIIKSNNPNVVLGGSITVRQNIFKILKRICSGGQHHWVWDCGRKKASVADVSWTEGIYHNHMHGICHPHHQHNQCKHQHLCPFSSSSEWWSGVWSPSERDVPGKGPLPRPRRELLLSNSSVKTQKVPHSQVCLHHQHFVFPDTEQTFC